MTNLAQGLVVAAIYAGSIAEEMEIECSDQLLSVDRQEIKDIIDYQY